MSPLQRVRSTDKSRVKSSLLARHSPSGKDAELADVAAKTHKKL